MNKKKTNTQHAGQKDAYAMKNPASMFSKDLQDGHVRMRKRTLRVARLYRCASSHQRKRNKEKEENVRGLTSPGRAPAPPERDTRRKYLPTRSTGEPPGSEDFVVGHEEISACALSLLGGGSRPTASKVKHECVSHGGRVGRV